MQERQKSTQTETFIEHSTQVQEYIVNMHGLHNAHYIRRHFPRAVTAPIPLFSSSAERRTHHDQLAARLRGTQKERKEKQAATKRKKKGDNILSREGGKGAVEQERATAQG
jgi:hypothetical protein